MILFLRRGDGGIFSSHSQQCQGLPVWSYLSRYNLEYERLKEDYGGVTRLQHEPKIRDRIYETTDL